MIDLGHGEDMATGIKFVDCSAAALGQALGQAQKLFADRERLAKVRGNGMRTDFSWTKTTAEYDKLYAKIKKPTA